jgi:putative ABC transport system permease protein
MAMESLLQDLRRAARRLWKTPAFTLVAVLVVAVGIGANAAIFSVVNATLLAPSPFPEPDRLVRVWDSSPQRGEEIDPVPPASFHAYREETGVFETLGAATDGFYNLTGAGEPEALLSYRFSADAFRALGVKPVLGRTFTAEEDRPGHDGVVVLSQDLWQRRFASDPAILGRALTLDGRACTVVGVMPSSTSFGPIQLWTPLALDPATAGDRQRRFLRLFGRLKPGVTLEQASAALARVAARLEREHPDTNSGWTALAEPIDERLVGDIRPALKVLTAAVAFVLLIACANVANLLLVRAAGRERESAVRVALGAGRGRLIRESLAESLLVAVAGGALGVWLAGAGVNLLLAFFPRNLGNVAIPRLQAIPIDARVLGFSLLLVLASGVLCGLAPALRASSADPADCLRDGGRTTSGVARSRLRSLLVASEMALALVLTSAAALMVHSFARLQSGRLGFEPDRVLTMRLTLPRARYDADGQRRFLDQALRNIREVPGVQAVGATTFLPLSGWHGDREFAVEGRTPPARGQEPHADFRVIGGDIFAALGTPLVRGRLFAEGDQPSRPRVAVVNETFARRHFPSEDPLGRRIDFRIRSDGDQPEWREIVGVVGDIRHHGLVREPVPEVYVPFAQEPLFLFGLAIRTAGEPAALAGAVRQAIWQVDKDQPVAYVLPMRQMAAETTALHRTSTLTLLAFTTVALFLAALGLYGVLSYTVSQRSHEIGIRVAMGATRRDILRLVMGQGLRLAGAGLATGLLASLALTRLLSSLLFGVSPYDVPTLAIVVVALLATALLASFLPAFRATRVSPLDALRYE